MLFFEITNRRANFLKKQFHNWSKFVAVQTNSLPGTVVLAQLVERLVRIQSLAKIYLYWTFFYCKLCIEKCCKSCVNVFFKWAIPSLFLFIFVFSNKQTIFTTNICEKMSILCTMLGFEPTTFRSWVSSNNHSTRASTLLRQHFVAIWVMSKSWSPYLVVKEVTFNQEIVSSNLAGY